MTDNSSQNIRLGTRGSLLARSQSQLIADALEKAVPGLKVELKIIKTTGDRVVDRPLYEVGGKGVFTKELEQALLAKEIDYAVHSFKDVPVTMPLVDTSELMIAAVPPRENPSDVFISHRAKSLSELPAGARIGTSSLRRRCQVLAVRSDLQIESVRGNIDTRLKKLAENQFDAIILAAAGLRRTGLFDENIMTEINAEVMLPAAGQGALALQCRCDDAPMRETLARLNDPVSERCVAIERNVVAALNGDCHSPIACLCVKEGERLWLRVAVGSRGGGLPVLHTDSRRPVDKSQDLVDEVVNQLRIQGVRRHLHA